MGTSGSGYIERGWGVDRGLRVWEPQGQGTQRGDRGQTEVSGCGYLRDRVHREGIGADRGLRVWVPQGQGTQRGDRGRQRSQGVGTSGTGYTERG